MPLRIFNGDTAIGGFREAFGEEAGTDVLVCRDVLICGPLRQFTTMEEWRADREAFWGSLLESLDAGPGFSGRQAGDVSFLSKWRDLYADTDELTTADSIEVWVGRALSDQLLLVFVAFLIDLLGIARERLSVVQMRERNGRPILGIGELRPQDIRAHPVPASLSDDDLDYCADIWRAVTADTPELLISALHGDDARLPLLHSALNALRHRFPDARTGLSLWDQMLLERAVEPGCRASRIIATTMSATRDGGHPLALDSVGDWYLLHRLRNLAQTTLAEPLVEARAPSASKGLVEYMQTEAGRAVLAGERNALDVNGIDDRISGVHLSSDSGIVWVRQDGAIVRR